MFAGKNCQGLVILIVHPANDTPKTNTQFRHHILYRRDHSEVYKEQYFHIRIIAPMLITPRLIDD
jgi:hypothetical protein